MPRFNVTLTFKNYSYESLAYIHRELSNTPTTVPTEEELERLIMTYITDRLSDDLHASLEASGSLSGFDPEEFKKWQE